MEGDKELEVLSRDWIIKKFKLLFNSGVAASSTEQKDTETSDALKFIAIRHALSEYNVKIESKFIIDPTLNRFDPSLLGGRCCLDSLDTPLHSIGLEQCESQQAHANLIETNLVLISPLQRTLQTAITIFKTHPNRSNIRFLVHPMIAESLNSACCLSVSHVREKYTKLAAEHGIKLDYSILDDQTRYPHKLTWQVDQLDNADEKKAAATQAANISEEAYLKYISDTMNSKEYFENWTQLLTRANTFKVELRQILEANKESTTCIVSHGNFLKCLTWKGFDSVGWVIGKEFKNCEMAWLEA